MPSQSDLQRKLIHYLTTPGHAERATAFEDLHFHGAFAGGTHPDMVVNIVRNYVNENAHGFCNDGIDRLKKAFPEIFPEVTVRSFKWTSENNIDTEFFLQGYAVKDGRFTRHVKELLRLHPDIPEGGKIVAAITHSNNENNTGKNWDAR